MKNIKLYIFIAIIIVIFGLNYLFGWSDYLADISNLEKMKTMINDNFALWFIIYCGITVIGCVALALPGITFAIAAGALFGPFWGSLACLIATTIGAMVAFLAGRFFLQDTIKPRAMKNAYLKKWLFDESSGNQLFILMITRLVPLFPFNLQNFAYGVTDISFGVYSIGTFVFMIPGVAMYTIGTAGIADSKNRILYFALAAVMAVVAFGMSYILKKKYGISKEEK